MNQKTCLYTGIVFLFSLIIPFHWRDTHGLLKAPTDSALMDPLSNTLSTYYKFTNLASRAIYTNDFNTASSFYDSAFIYKEHPFYVDLVNDILVNDKNCYYDKNDAAIYQLITFKKIDTAQLFTKIPRSAFDEKNLILINKLIKERNKIKNKENYFQTSLREMFNVDQKIRDFDTISNYKILYARIDSIESENFIRFENLYEKFGLPGEEMVGIFFDEDNQWDFIIYHLLSSFMHKKNEEMMQSVIAIIEKGLQTGELHPSICATLLDKINPDKSIPSEFNFMNTTMYIVDREVYKPFVFYGENLMDVVNANRIAIGLDSFHITQQQVVCHYLGTKALKGKNLIVMAQYAQLANLPSGFVRMSAKEANVDLSTYKINTTKIAKECRCKEKIY